MSNAEAELINEFEYQYYGFSPIGFTDSIYNIMLEAWEEEVKKVSFELVPQVYNNKKYLNRIIRMFFIRNKVRRAFAKFTDRALKYILRIPRHVTLPEHVNTFELALSGPEVKSSDELNRECEKLEAQLVEDRFVYAELNQQIEEANSTMEVLRTLITELQRVSLDSNEDTKDCGNISMMVMD